MATITPDFSQAVQRYHQGHKDAAAAICHELLAQAPGDLAALRMLSVIAREAEQFPEAFEWIDRALRLAPHDALLWFEHGCIHFAQNQLDAAAADYRRAIDCQPDFQEAVLNVGVILEAQEQYAEARQWDLRALALRPSCPKAHYNLGNVYRATGQLSEAIGAYQQSLRLDPLSAKTQWNLGHTYLLAGDFAHGWRGHEFRGPAGEVSFDHYLGPRWDGSSLAGKTLLVHAEQGLGDEVMFASCYQELVEQARQCIFVCDPRMAPLLTRALPKATVYGRRRMRDQSPCPVTESYDYQIPAGSVPLYLRSTAADFPNRPNYLQADAEATAAWRRRLAELGPGLKIGLSWRAGGKPSERQRRTTGLEAWQDLFAVPGTHWINLQYGHTTDDLAEARRQLGVEIHDFIDGDPLVDLDEFAAKMSALDLVISVGNATVHLAGALGVPTWCVLPPVPGWRWQIAGTTSPWYSSVRLIRQQAGESWSAVLAQLQPELLAMAGGQGGAGSPRKVPVNTSAPKRARKSEQLQGLLSAGEFTERAVPAALASAVELHQAGNLAGAERIYQEILAHVPRNVDAQRLLGILALQTGRTELAITALRRALAAGDDSVETQLHYAASLREAGQFDAARQAYLQALDRAPANAEARLGLGKMLVKLFQPDAALREFEQAIRLAPQMAEAHRGIAVILLDDGLVDEAIAACRRAIAARGNYVAGYHTMALALRKQGHAGAAGDALQAALEHEPEQFDCLFMLGELLAAEGRHAEAATLYRRAIAVRPTSAAALNNLGLALRQQGEIDEALRQFEAAIAADAQLAVAHFNRGQILLQHDQYALGWPEHAWRWRCPGAPARPDQAGLPRWAGEPLAGRTILVHGESTPVDDILYASCLADLVAAARGVIVRCDSAIAPLLARSLPTAQVIANSASRGQARPLPGGQIDFQVVAGDVPAMLRRERSHFLRQPYLQADPAAVADWRKRLARLGPGPKVGISWQAANSATDAVHSEAVLAHWQPLLATRGVEFVCLEPGERSVEVAFCRQLGGRLHAMPEVPGAERPDAQAALLAALDLVISVSNVNLHLAAALGTPAWGLLSCWPNWPWPLSGNTPPWYAGVRLWRQSEPGDWTELFERVSAEFLNWLSAAVDETRTGKIFSQARIWPSLPPTAAGNPVPHTT